MIRGHALAGFRRTFAGLLVDRAAVERRTNEVDYSGVPIDNRYAAVSGLEAVPCRIQSAPPSSPLTQDVTDINRLGLRALFGLGTSLEIGDRLVVGERVYRITGLQDDMTDIALQSASITRVREETA